MNEVKSMWRKVFWNEIKLNDLGEANLVGGKEESIIGEIHTVRVELGDSGPETKVEIETSEGETIVYDPVNESFVDYPIHAGNPVYKSFSGGEKVDNLVRYLNHGSLIVRVSGDHNSVVSRIVIVIEV